MDVDQAIKTDSRREEQFNDIMANIKPFDTVGKGKNQRTIIGSAVVPLSLCYVDERYRGMWEHKKIKNLEKNQDIHKLTPIVLVPHCGECRLPVVDGNGRCVVAPLKGLDRLNVIILMDAPEGPEERLEFEAEYFVRQDSEVENVKSIEKYLARVTIRDETATVLDELLKKYDIKFVSKKGNKEESILGSYTDTYSIARAYGEKCLDFVPSVIANAGRNKETNGYTTYIMRSLKEVQVAYPSYRKEMNKYLSKELRQLDPGLFSSCARTEYPKRDHRMSCVPYMEDLVCDGLGIEKKIYIDNGKKYKVVR